MSDNAHSKFSASKAVMWMACAGALKMNEGRNNTSSKYAAEGTAAHLLASWCLADWSPKAANAGLWPEPAAGYIGRKIEVDGYTFEVDAAMAGHVQTYLDNIAAYAKGAELVLVEQRVNYAAELQVDVDDAFGTADCIIVAENGELQAHDLKFGQGEEVEAETPQLKLYLLGARPLVLSERIRRKIKPRPIEHVRSVIHQPRLNPAPKEWDNKAYVLDAFALKARDAADKADIAFYAREDELPKMLNPGEKQCRWCAAKAECPALRDEVAAIVSGSTAATPDEFANLDAGQPHAVAIKDQARPAAVAGWLAACLSKVDMIEEWCKAVRKEAEAQMLNGNTLPGYKLVRGKRGNREWSDEDQAVAMLKTFRLRDDIVFVSKPKSPTQVEETIAPTVNKDGKVTKEGLIGLTQWKRLQSLIRQADGKLHVAPESDPRPAADVKPVAEDFNDITAPGDGDKGAGNRFAKFC